MKPLLPILLVGLAACADAPAEPNAAAPEPGALPGAADAAGLALAATDGGEVVAWVDSSSRLLVRPAGQTEATVVSTDRVSAHTQAGPRLGVLPDGSVIIAYVVEREVPGRRHPASELRLARSEDGGVTFGDTVAPYPDPGFLTSHTFHSLAVGPDGAIYVAWLDGTARDRARTQPASAQHAARRPPVHLASAPNGGRAGPDPGTDLVIARSTDGGRTFDTPVVVASGTCQCCRTALHASDDGEVYVVWRHIFEDGARDVAIARSDDRASSFTAPVRVYNDGWVIDGCPHTGPAVTTDDAGVLHVAWSTGVPARMGVWHAASADRGATFGAPEPLATPAPLGQVRAVRDGAGRALFAFEDARTKTVGVVAAGAADTLRVPGNGADLVGGPDGWSLIWNDGSGARLHGGS